MDTYRGNMIDRLDGADDWPEVDYADREIDREPPPSPVGQDERRMQVRAYNHWAGLLDNRNFPSIEDLEPDNLPDFGPFSVLLDFTQGIEDPSILYLGEKLAEECGTGHELGTLADVPSRSLLSRITDHYMQILANQAPIGFEAEFVNQRERTILYRGILLPFSSDDDTIDFIYGVINWKELADQHTTDELLLEVEQALDAAAPADRRRDEPMTDWADGPSEPGSTGEPPADQAGADILDLAAYAVDRGDGAAGPAADAATPADGGQAASGWAQIVAEHEADRDRRVSEMTRPIDFALAGQADPHRLFLGREDDDGNPADGPAGTAPGAQPGDDIDELDEAAMGLADWLAAARELADAAKGSEDRTRHALYAAIGRAYDFSLAALAAPDDFAELVADSGLTTQDRAPMTPVVKLVFGADYDKTRLTEYASALSHGHRLGLRRGALARYLAEAPGGLKGVVTEERRLKREESGTPASGRDTPREALARRLRQLAHQPLDSLTSEGNEFTLVLARRLDDGRVVMLGEVADIALLERAAKSLLG